MIERCYSLRRAAAMLGVARSTLKTWLAEEGLVMPELGACERAMIRESLLERLIAKRSPKPAGMRAMRKAS